MEIMWNQMLQYSLSESCLKEKIILQLHYYFPLFKFLFFINFHVINVNLVERIELSIVTFSLANYCHEFEYFVGIGHSNNRKINFLPDMIKTWQWKWNLRIVVRATSEIGGWSSFVYAQSDQGSRFWWKKGRKKSAWIFFPCVASR